MNNDFFVTREAIRQWFSLVTSSLVKIIAESPHEWQKIVIHGNSCIILYILDRVINGTRLCQWLELSLFGALVQVIPQCVNSLQPPSNFSRHLKIFKDVLTWWRHQTEHFLRYWPFVRGIHRWPANSPHKGQWRGALVFSLICVWTNGWVNNRDASDLRRHRLHYDVIVMSLQPPSNIFRHLKIFKHVLSNTFWRPSNTNGFIYIEMY